MARSNKCLEDKNCGCEASKFTPQQSTVVHDFIHEGWSTVPVLILRVRLYHNYLWNRIMKPQNLWSPQALS
jgi:hypothetical protein